MLQENNSPVVVFVWFRETATSLMSQFRINSERDESPIRAAFITGDVTKQQVIPSPPH